MNEIKKKKKIPIRKKKKEMKKTKIETKKKRKTRVIELTHFTCWQNKSRRVKLCLLYCFYKQRCCLCISINNLLQQSISFRRVHRVRTDMKRRIININYSQIFEMKRWLHWSSHDWNKILNRMKKDACLLTI